MANMVVRLLQERKAGRSIFTETVPEDIVAELAEAARLTPSCYNKQPWRFLFLTSEPALSKGRQALAEGNRAWATRAPLLVVGYSRQEDDCVAEDGRAYHEFDLGMSVMNLMLAATYRGLAARPMAGFDPGRITRDFALPEGCRPLIMIAVGKPSRDESHLPDHYRGLEGKPRNRKPITEIARML